MQRNITYLLAENLFQVFNLPKTNIATKNGGFQLGSNRNLLFQGSIFRGYYMLVSDMSCPKRLNSYIAALAPLLTSPSVDIPPCPRWQKTKENRNRLEPKTAQQSDLPTWGWENHMSDTGLVPIVPMNGWKYDTQSNLCLRFLFSS